MGHARGIQSQFYSLLLSHSKKMHTDKKMVSLKNQLLNDRGLLPGDPTANAIFSLDLLIYIQPKKYHSTL